MDESPAASSGVRASAINGVAWLTAQKWATRLLGFVTIAVLTRLLSPEDFGTVAAASTVLPFFFLIADIGFAAFIVQVERTTTRMLSTAFWFSLTAGAVLCGLLVGLAPLLGLAFRDDGVVPVLQVLAVWVVIAAAGSVPLALLRREMRFRTLALQGALAAGVAQIVAIIMAFSGFGVWALVGQTLVAPVFTTTLAWIAAKWHPSREFSFAEFRVMAVFGGKVLGVEFIAMLRAWGEAAIISATLGIAALGFMSIAQRLIQVVQELTGSAIVPVTTVAFARLRNEPERLRAAYLRAIGLSYAALSLPLTIVAVGAALIVPILFGSGWEESFPVAQVLALAGILTVSAALDHGLFYGLGRPGTWFVYAVIIDGLTLALTFILAPHGLVAIATGFLGVCVVATIARWFLSARLLEVHPFTVARPFGYLLVAVGLSGGAGWAVLTVTADMPSWIRVLLAAVVMTALHIGVTRVVAPSTFRDAVSILRGSSRVQRLTRFLPHRKNAKS